MEYVSLGSEAREEAYLEMYLPDASKRPAFRQDETPRNRAIVDSEGVWLHTEKEDAFIETLKGSFPWYNRHWEPSRTAWRVEGAENIRSAIGIFKTFFPEGVVIHE
jgi:hypothetical protein